jgi:hypothetical protein
LKNKRDVIKKGTLSQLNKDLIRINDTVHYATTRSMNLMLQRRNHPIRTITRIKNDDKNLHLVPKTQFSEIYPTGYVKKKVIQIRPQVSRKSYLLR